MELLLLVILLVWGIPRLNKRNKAKNASYKIPIQTVPIQKESEVDGEIDRKDDSLPIAGAYQKSWMFTYNEKEAYNKLKPIAEELGYTVFAKVRLLDLVEPIKGNRKYKTYFYKIQAKHVDFVLCDERLVARCIIELDDSSHQSEPRKERDDFVDKVVTSVGYKIIRVQAITDDIREQLK